MKLTEGVSNSSLMVNVEDSKSILVMGSNLNGIKRLNTKIDQFHQHFTGEFFARKQIVHLFSNYSLAL